MRKLTKQLAITTLVRADFVAAVLLTVIAPLVLLARAVRRRQQDLITALLGYWRASSLLMVALYLLIGERRAGFVCGIGARLLIPYTVLRHAADDPWYGRWRQLVSGYCVLGVLLNVPVLRCVRSERFFPLCQAYIASAQQFGDVVHAGVDRETLGRAGEWGLRAFVAGVVLDRVTRLAGGRLKR